MDKQQLAMVSSKVLAEMAAYRKTFLPFTNYNKACELIETEIEKFRSDISDVDIPSVPRMLIRKFESQLINIAAKSLLAAAECGKVQKRWDEVFETLFETLGSLDYDEDTYNYMIKYGEMHVFNECVVSVFNQFKYDLSINSVNPDSLYLIAANCLIFFNHIEFECNPIVKDEAI